MTTAAAQTVSPAATVAAPATGPLRPAASSKHRLTGHAVYMYAFDLGYELNRIPVQELLGQPVATFAVDASKRAPRHLFFYRPQMVRLPPIEKIGPQGLVRIERAVKLLPVGAISITFKVPFDVDRLEDLVAFHDLQFSDGTSAYDDVRALAEQVRQALQPYLIRPTPTIGDEEAYTVFCLNGPIPGGEKSDKGDRPVNAEDWLLANRRAIASVLTEEADTNYLSDQEADESSARYFSYSQTDIVVLDWDAALIVDEPRQFDEVLYVMELANLQLAELEAYDRILDDAVETSYRDLTRRSWWGLRESRTQKELREIRIDLARLSDELENITKFFGDWHLARVYQGLAARFHLGDWHRSIDGKLKTLDDIYQLLHSDRTNRIMLFLELAIVAMFLFEIIKPFVSK
jgi:hypothetical protein